MIDRKGLIRLLGTVLGLAAPFAVQAQSSVSEDFTGTSTTNQWYFFNGACLTAGTATGAMTGGAFNQVFLPPSEAAAGLGTNPAYADTTAIGMQTNAAGSSFITSNSAGTSFLIYETNQVEAGNGGNNIQGGSLGLNLPPNTIGRRISWIERR